MYQCSKKLVTYKEYSFFGHSNFPAHSMFTFHVCWGSLATSIFENSSLVASNTLSRLPSRLSFCLLWLCYHEETLFIPQSFICFWWLLHISQQNNDFNFTLTESLLINTKYPHLNKNKSNYERTFFIIS